MLKQKERFRLSFGFKTKYPKKYQVSKSFIYEKKYNYNIIINWFM